MNGSILGHDVDMDLTGLMKRIKDLRKDIEEKKEPKIDPYKILAENLSDVILTTDMDLRITYFSPSVESMLGYSQYESTMMPMEDIFRDESINEITRVYTSFVMSEGVENIHKFRSELLDLTLMKKDGNEILGEGNLSFYCNDDGSPQGLLIVIRDITQKQKYLHALERSRARYKDLLDNANEIIQSVDPEGRFIYVNNKWVETLGYTDQEAMDLDFTDVVAKEELDHCVSMFHQVMEGEEIGDVTTVLVAKNGRKVILEGTINALFDDDDEFVSTRGIFRDVTEKRRLESELKKKEEMYRFIAENTSDIITILDLDYNIRYVSPSHSKFLHSIPELIGRSKLELIHPDDVREVRSMLDQAIKDDLKKVATQLKFRYKDKLGKHHSLNCTANVIKDEDGSGSILMVCRESDNGQ